MHEVGLIVWVVLLIVGVTSSIVSSVRKASGAQPKPRLGPVAQSTPPPRQATVKELVGALQAQAQAQAQADAPQGRGRPAALPANPPAPRPARPAKPAVAADRRADPQPDHLTLPGMPGQTPGRRPLFGRRGDAVRGIIAAEVFGSPRGLRDEPFWR